MIQRQAFILDGIVSEDATKQKAQRDFDTEGGRTKIHYHAADVKRCNDRCGEWPPEPRAPQS